MTLRAFAVAFGLVAAPAASFAQTTPVDPRWAPYLGCWQLLRESTAMPVADLAAVASRRARASESREDVMICVTPAPQTNAVSQQTVLNGESVLDEVVAADGAPRTGEDGRCRSTRRAEWSTSGRQLFTRGTVSCEGQPERTITGLSLVMPGPTWVDVQMVDVRGSKSVRVRRYGATREQRRLVQTPVAGSPAPLERWIKARDEINEQIIAQGWNEEKHALVQHYGTDVLDASVLAMLRLHYLVPTDAIWLGTLAAIEDELVSDSLVYRYNPEASPDGLRGSEGTFSMCTFWYVDALTRTGRIDDARLVFEKMLTYANHLGLYGEEIGDTGEQLGNFPQAFTHLSLITAAVGLDHALNERARGAAPTA